MTMSRMAAVVVSLLLIGSAVNVSAESLLDGYETESTGKNEDWLTGKKKDEIKNPISKMLFLSKTRMQQVLKKFGKNKSRKGFHADPDVNAADYPFSLLEFNHKNRLPGDPQTEDTRQIDHRPDLLNRVNGDSLKKLGIGTPVYCTLAGIVSHSGIAIGDKIIHLDGNGVIIFTSPQEFINRFEGNNPAVNIYYAAYSDNVPLEFDIAAVRAMSRIGKKVKYNAVKKNCHAFTIWCFSGKFNEPVLSIKKVEKEIEKQCGKDWRWRAWDGWR